MIVYVCTTSSSGHWKIEQNEAMPMTMYYTMIKINGNSYMCDSVLFAIAVFKEFKIIAKLNSHI